MKDFPEYWAETGQHIVDRQNLGGNAFRAGQRYQTAKAKGSAELALLSAKQEHGKVCKRLDVADDLIDKLYASGCLDTEREQMIIDYLG